MDGTDFSATTAPGAAARGAGGLWAGAGHLSRRVRSIDALRGIAAFAVVLGHALEQALRFMVPGGIVAQAIRNGVIEYANLGRIGVVTFFIASGYVIPFSFSYNRPVPSFLIARFFRLYPAYWVSIAGAVIVAIAIGGGIPPAWRIAANATMVQAALGQDDLIGVYWTLFYELLFYMMCLTAFVIRRMEDPHYLVSVVVILCAAGMTAAFLRYDGTMPGVPIGPPIFLAIMHLGTLVRLSDRGDGAAATACYRIGLAVVLLTAGPILAIGFRQHASSQRLIADVTSLYIGLAMFLGLRRSAGLAHPWLLFLGLISYSLYLFHPLCLDVIVALARRVDGRVAAPFVVVAVPASAVVLAATVQHLVEVPMNDAGKRLRMRALRIA